MTREKVTRTLAPAVIAVAALIGATPADAAAGGDAAPRAAEKFRDGVALVGFRAGTTVSRRRAITRAAGAKSLRTVGAGTRVMRVSAGGVREAIARFRQHPEVRYAEPDYVVHATGAPSDPYYRKLWGMDAIQADLAWASTLGTPAVVVGVVDTGVDYNHPDLAANVWSSAGPINGCPAGTHGYNAITAACDPMDDHRHGTHVSGTIGAVGNNGIGVIGVNGTTRIMGLKFLSSGGSGAISDAAEAIDWAVRAKQAGVNLRVLSNSWGGGGFSQALLDAINKAGMNDILFVAAAGNAAGNDDTTPFYPCSYRAANEICVAATDKTDALAGFSNYGENSVDLAAPGSGIYSTMLGGTYDYMSGTSMATPHVSGAAALALSGGYQSVWTLRTTVRNAVDPITSLIGRVATGGRLNVCKAIPACSGVAPPAPTPPPVTTGDFSLSSPGGREAVASGSSVAYTVTVTPSGGFMGQVNLSLSGLPAGATAAFAPTPLGVASSPASSVLTVTAGPATPPGNYTLAVTGTSTERAHSTTIALRVKRN